MSWQLSIIKQQCLQYKAQMTQSFVGLRCSGTVQGATLAINTMQACMSAVSCHPESLKACLALLSSPTKVTSLLVEPNAALHADMTMRLSQPATLMHSFHIAAGSDMC